jgi:hypothetical protein
MRNQILVDPHDMIARMHGEHRRIEAHRVDRHVIGLGGNGARRGRQGAAICASLGAAAWAHKGRVASASALTRAMPIAFIGSLLGDGRTPARDARSADQAFHMGLDVASARHVPACAVRQEERARRAPFSTRR